MTNNRVVNYVFKYMGDENKNNLEEYISKTLTREYTDFTEIDIMNITPELSEEEKIILRDYISYESAHINATLRHTWNYEANGNIENKTRYEEKGKKLVDLISKKPTNTGNKKVYRGIDINYFKQFGISSLEELFNLKNNYILDEGVVSTSVKEESCFYKRNLGPNTNYNIKVIYYLPEEFNDGIFLGSKDLKLYEESEDEYLINKYNLGYVFDVEINNQEQTAQLKVMMIPKKVYDDYYKNQEEINKSK